MTRGDVPSDVAAIRREINGFLNSKDAQKRIVGNAKYGVYAFYDYDGERTVAGIKGMEGKRLMLRTLTGKEN